MAPGSFEQIGQQAVGQLCSDLLRDWRSSVAVLTLVALKVFGVIGDKMLGRAARAALVPFAVFLTAAGLTRFAR